MVDSGWFFRWLMRGIFRLKLPAVNRIYELVP